MLLSHDFVAYFLLPSVTVKKTHDTEASKTYRGSIHRESAQEVTGWYKYLLIFTTNDSVSCFIRFQLACQNFVPQIVSQSQVMPFHSSAVLPPKHGIGGSRMSSPWCEVGSCEGVGHSAKVGHAFLECTCHKAEQHEYLRINGTKKPKVVILFKIVFV